MLKNVLGTLVCTLAAFFLSSCGSEGDTDSLPSGQQVLERRARDVLASTPGAGGEFPGNLITVDQLQARLENPEQAARMFLLDTRPRGEWDLQGHIEGANWIQMQKVADPDGLEQIPQDRLIVCISPTGHTAVQVATVLRWLGYDAVVLKHGMAAWTQTPAGQLMVSDARNGINKHYPVVKDDVSPAGEEIAARGFEPPPASDLNELTEAARDLLHEDVFDKPYPFNHIFADDLYQRLSDPAQKGSIFLLDIRPRAGWDEVGHIAGAVHMEWRNIGDPGNLALLPRDRLIVVIDGQGQHAGQVTPILRMLGYDAVTLRSGMTAWTQTPESQETIGAIEAARYPVVK